VVSEVAVNEAVREVAPIDDGLRAELTELTSTLCKALNDPKRLLLLYALADGPRSVGELTDAIGASQANVSQHLAVLRERGIVVTERRGPSVIYSLRYPELLDAIEQLRSILAQELARRHRLLAG
jgi:DNA-binding transcriptional ArsR family regulator